MGKTRVSMQDLGKLTPPERMTEVSSSTGAANQQCAKALPSTQDAMLLANVRLAGGTGSQIPPLPESKQPVPITRPWFLKTESEKKTHPPVKQTIHAIEACQD